MRGCTCHGLTLCPWCAALAERAGVLAPPEPPQVTEKAFMAAVVRLAREHQWLCYHTHNSRKSLPGYPDLTMAKAGQPLLLVELKVPGGQLTLQQQAWLDTLVLAQGKEVYVWQPEHWPLICAALRR